MASEISPRAEISPKAKIGNNCKIFPFVYIEDDVESARSKFYPNITITGNASFTNNLGAIVNPGKVGVHPRRQQHHT